MHSFLRDLRFALRQLRKKPGFTLVTVVTLALGIGATTSIFSLVNTVVLRPLPYPESDRIMNIASGWQRSPNSPIVPGALSYPDYFDFKNQNHSFSAFASFHDTDTTLTGRGEPMHVSGEVVGNDYFRVLGVRPALGRDFTVDDEKPQSNTVILSHQLWVGAFESDPNIVGKSATINNVNCTVIGVMPNGFAFPFSDPAPSFYTTLAWDAFDSAGDPVTSQRGAHFLESIGRLRDGVSLQQAQADLKVIAGNLNKQYPDTDSKLVSAVVRTEKDRLVGDTRPMLRILFAAVSFVLLIACANVAGLLLARSTQRRGEIAIRTALGASRIQIVRQILLESLVLSVMGGILGILLSTMTLATLIHLVPKDLPRLAQVAVDREALLFALATSVVTALLFGGLPAWRLSRLHPSQSIRQGSRSVTADRTQHRLQHALIIAETAIGLVLLVGSALLIHTFVNVLRVDPGFDSHNMLLADLSLPDTQYPGVKIDRFYRELLPAISNIPGVVNATAAFPVPLSGNGMRISIQLQEHPVPQSQEPSEAIAVVTPDYFKTMRIPIVKGREFSWTDTEKTQAVMLVTQSFARKYYQDQDPIGKLIRAGLGDGVTKSSTYRQIVGVVADVKTLGLTEDMVPQYYLPLSQALITGPSLAIRTHGDATSILPAVRQAVASLDKSIPLYGVRTMDEYVSNSAAQSRFQAVLLSCFAAMALVLFAVGLYAVLSYTVAQRTTEIGVRMALGAKREDMLRMFLNQGLRLTAIGGVIGLLASVGLTRLMTNMLYQVKALDVSSFFTVPVIVAIVSVIASAIPAVRAMSVNPMTALKDE